MLASMVSPGWMEFLAALVISGFVWIFCNGSVRIVVARSMRRFSIYGLFMLTLVCSLCLVIWRVLGMDDLFFLLFVVLNVVAMSIVAKSTPPSGQQQE